MAVQKELSDATAHITTLNSQLEQLQSKSNTGLMNSALKQVSHLIASMCALNSMD